LNSLKLIRVLWPEQFVLSNYKRRPLAAFNPGVASQGDRIFLFPRMVFEYRRYISSIALLVSDLDTLLSKEIPEGELLITPELEEELLGAEDPRCYIYRDKIWILYSGKRSSATPPGFSFQQMVACLDLDTSSLEKKGSITHPFPSCKNGAIVSKPGKYALLAFRPEDPSGLYPWLGLLDTETLRLRDIKPAIPLEESWIKAGWSTNFLDVRGGYFGLYHALCKDLAYRHGFALLSKKGDLIYYTALIIEPKHLPEIYGDRPFTIYGCGLSLLDETIYFWAGLGDFCIGIYEMDLSEALSLLDRSPARVLV